MPVKTNLRNIPFSLLQKLNSFEDDVFEYAKGVLNRSHKDFSVKIGLILKEWAGVPVKVTHNACDGLIGSREIVDGLIQYMSGRDDIELLLEGKYTIVVDAVLDRKITDNKAQQADKKPSKGQPEDSLPDFIPVYPRYTFDQIVLEPSVKKELFDAIKVIQCKDLIYNEWGFASIDPVPRSVLNFYGQPGTGKTMCAHAIASLLGKKIMALNYSEIESKYVGEAPKNLQKAFETARETNSVLFFDEADSFLGKRIENVTQGADQALNSLRSQMLIQLEEFSGVVLFATNLVTNFDPAFESRILKHIRFELPNQEARVLIIKKMIPPQLPLSAPLTEEEYNELSASIDGFSGREIKGAVLDLLLSKADPLNKDIIFTYDDFKQSFAKKKQEKAELKAEDERRLKAKIEKKLKEKAEEAEALKKQEEAAMKQEGTATSPQEQEGSASDTCKREDAASDTDIQEN